MLVLTRKRDETILIGDNIRVTVTDIRGDKVRIGIEAPENINIVREELAERELAGMNNYRKLADDWANAVSG